MKNMAALQETINYTFKNKNLLRIALTHSSYANENGMEKNAYNERIEFLGDAVLELASSDFIYRNNPELQEGSMTMLRAKLVCEESLAVSARAIHLGDYLLLGKGERLSHGNERNSILSDAFEAVIGAIYLDGGFKKAYEFVNDYVLSEYESRKYIIDSKTTLQEMVQSKYGVGVTYEVVAETGPEHDKHFRVAAYIGDKKMEVGEGNSKKSAAKDAAYKTIKILNGVGTGGKDVFKKH
ncbi:MAG: ribonuclease III [Lachnospiraceae bacterium]|nr:ribonuclease III [Lachnospiraceae bacterium]